MNTSNLLKNVGLALVLAGLLVLPLSSFGLFKYVSPTNENVLSVVDERLLEEFEEEKNQPELNFNLPDYYIVTPYPSK